MDYPESKMTLPVRRTILGVFIAAFFIISPLVILYTAGYRYDWQNGILRETGALNVDVLPRNATVFIDNEKLGGKIPIRLKNIKPKKYQIKIIAPGYYDWEKEIEIKNKQTIYIKEISLVKKNEPELLLAGPVKQIFLSPSKKYLVYTTNNQATEVWLENIADQNKLLLTKMHTNENIKVSWSKNNSYFTVSADKSPYNELYIFDAKRPEKQIELVNKVKYLVTKYMWKDSIEPELFFSTKFKIMSYLPSSDRQLTLSTNTFNDWQMEGGKLWTIHWDNVKKFFTITEDSLGFSSDFSSLTPTEIFGDEKFNLDDAIEILDAKNDRILIKKTYTPEMIMVFRDKKYSFAGEKFLVSDYNNWWLAWTPWELTTF
ncbi:MAG: PEGA domain-containing protein, partial [bacterium]